MARHIASTKNMPRFPEFDGYVVEMSRYDEYGNEYGESVRYTTPDGQVPLAVVMALCLGHVEAVEVVYDSKTSKEFRIVGFA